MHADPLPTLALPPLPDEQHAPSPSLLTVMVPVVGSLVLWAVTGSPLGLAFAALGPVLLVAGIADGRWRMRRERRREARRYADRLHELDRLIEDAHDLERQQAFVRTPAAGGSTGSAPRAGSGGGGPTDPLVVTVGRADVPSALRLVPERSGVERPDVRGLREKARVLTDAPLEVDLRRGLCVLGGGAGADALARAVVVQALCRVPSSARLDVVGAADRWLESGSLGSAPLDPGWLGAVPQRVRRLPDAPSTRARFVLDDGGAPATVVRGSEGDRWPSECETVVAVGAAEGRVLRHPEVPPEAAFLPDAVSALEAAQLVRALAAATATADGALPERVALAPLLAAVGVRAEGEVSAAGSATGGALQATERSSLRCALGVGAGGVVDVDLLTDGPHAVIGGTTGSGKSELLRSWVLALAAPNPPDLVQLLLLDFKGGSTFAELDRLPHTVGVLTDLDLRTVRRAVAGIRAELTRRERVLAATGARSIDALPRSDLARLVIVVDEFAALAEQLPECHAVLGDVAARGRSLGVHLILATQRPAGVVRDALLANAGLRICLRVTSEDDSRAVIGVPDAARLERPGRAVVAAAGAPRIELQVAESDPGLPDRIARGWGEAAEVAGVRVVAGSGDGAGPGQLAGHTAAGAVAGGNAAGHRAAEPARAARRPWLPELPARLGPADLPAGDGLVFGVVDRPDLQRRLPAAWDPGRDGALLVLGAPRSGRSTALAAVAAAVGAPEPIRPRPTLPCVWDAVGEALARLDADERRPILLLLDDIDAVIAAAGSDYAHELADRLLRVLRSGSAAGMAVALTAARIPSVLGAATALAGCRLLLRAASRDEHLLAGGTPGTYDPSAPPGRGELAGATVQVALVDPQESAPFEHAVELGTIAAPVPPGLLGISTRPAHLLQQLGAVAKRLGGVDSDAHPPETVLIGSPDEWQARWSALRTLAAVRPVLVDGLTPGDVRALLGRQELPPPCTGRARWLLRPEEAAVRVRLGDAR